MGVLFVQHLKRYMMAPSKSMTTFLAALENVCSKDEQTALKAVETCKQLQMSGELSKKEVVMETGALDIMIEATSIEGYSGQYYHHVLWFVSEAMLVDDDDAYIEKHVDLVLEKGGIPSVLRVMKAHPSTNFLLLSCLFCFDIIGDCLTSEKYETLVGSSMLEAVIGMLENNQDTSSALFRKSCDLMITFCRKGPSTLETSVFCRTVQCVMNGICMHLDCTETKDIGRSTLAYLIGPEKTIEFMDHIETHQIAEAEVGPAA